MILHNGFLQEINMNEDGTKPMKVGTKFAVDGNKHCTDLCSSTEKIWFKRRRVICLKEECFNS